MTGFTSWRRGWTAFVVSVVARSVLGLLLLLMTAATVPALAGWETSVVMSGSMAPALQAGDVVVVRPVDAEDLAVGTILLVDDPDAPGMLRLHRLEQVEAGGLRLRGDANAEADVALVAPSAVHGAGVWSAPRLGLPALWLAEGRTVPLALTGAGLAALLALALLHRPDDDRRGTDGTRAVAPARRRPGRRALAVGTAAVALAAGLPPITGAGAVFSASTANHANSFAAAPYFTCTSAGAGVDAPGYLPLQETAGPTATNVGTAGWYANATYAGGITYRVNGPTCGAGGDKAVRLDGSSGRLYTTVALDNPQTFTAQLWFSTSTNRGGKLVGFGNGANGAASGQYDRHVYMRNDGRLTFGVYNGTPTTVTSPAAYNNGAWHLVTATFSPSTGMRLYVNGALVGSAAATSAEPYTGYWRVGYDSLATSWPSAPTSPFFGGSVAHVMITQNVLSAAQIAQQYAVSR
ncbi:signal peptidase I [Blastococcus aurantiacus]|uniref:Signal peptidase I n=1 Tax=Blastococcus aurantiacus TaxID=1550231 RepID=A0A1G7QM73_9ACTN|nr:LamG-like jellyroll fold domain-containing protein [Blastococcus aurantiacus]SDF99575.1 signal peptidase I [Blastococcus aurantiacus]